ncbi:hypothetical protein C0R05_32200 [Streptomyces albidoflavus]|nr:hypothetical protein C0R05_32200 [Streptomyces albidoflavus]
MEGHAAYAELIQEARSLSDSQLAMYADLYRAVDEGKAIPVRADKLRAGMEVVAAVRLENRVVDAITWHAAHTSNPFLTIYWKTRDHHDSYSADGRVALPGDHQMVTLDSLDALFRPEHDTLRGI